MNPFLWSRHQIQLGSQQQAHQSNNTQGPLLDKSIHDAPQPQWLALKACHQGRNFQLSSSLVSYVLQYTCVYVQ